MFETVGGKGGGPEEWNETFKNKTGTQNNLLSNIESGGTDACINGSALKTPRSSPVHAYTKGVYNKLNNRKQNKSKIEIKK
jgi:hypothetical protein